MTRKIDLTKTVYELVESYPELMDIMAEIGFTEIKKKAVLNSIGKLMTIPKGAKMKNIPMGTVEKTFLEHGFELVGSVPAEDAAVQDVGASTASKLGSQKELLKSYLKRLGAGEDLEEVRADFVANFSEVDPSEIMAAEQELIAEGTPLEEVQRLCDVHSALFHGATTEEKIANAERAVQDSLREKSESEEINYSDKNARAAQLAEIVGHPLYTLNRENEVLRKLIEKIRAEFTDEGFESMRDLSIHYAKKGDLIYPHLKVKYGISGPSDVMWTVDDEIRDEIGALARETQRTDRWHARLNAVLDRAEEMIYKEENILFPICAVNFTEKEWMGIYHDAKDYSKCFGVEEEIWQEAEDHRDERRAEFDGEIVLPGGHMSIEELTALLDTIPLEITFVDADDINRFFNDGPKVFKRPSMAIDRKVYSCHPPKIEPMVRSIIEDFRSGVRDTVPVWMEKGGKTMLVTYMAVRDKAGKYLGTMEIVQDMEFAKEYFQG